MQQPVQMPEQSLDRCAEEKIHIPGAIQPHGVLLAVTEDTLSIVQTSESVLTVFGIMHEDLIGQPIGVLIGSEQQLELARQLSNDKIPLNSLQFIVSVPINNNQLMATIHRSDGLLIIEMEEATDLAPDQALDFFRTTDQAIAQVLACTSLSELLQTATEFVRAFTGFDRTMIYLFDLDWNGTVLAECKAAEVKSYLGLKFPASDIPVQARELYKRNRLRLLVNVDAAPSPILPSNNPLTSAPLDLSESILRAMSPVHIEYLKNMGVAASMSVSLISHGELKGLIACHHTSAKHVDYRVRRACDFVARLVSLQSDAMQERETFRILETLKDARKDLLAQISQQENLPQAIASSGALLNVVGAKGAAVIWDEQCFVVGETPDEQDIGRLVAHLLDRSLPLFVTDSLSQYVPFAKSITASASGLLAIRVATSGSKWLLWFRPEQLEELAWAGKHDDFVAQGSAPVSLPPRRSFELWKEAVSGKSVTWLSCEVQSALELRTDLLDISLSISEKAHAAALEKQVEELNELSEVVSVSGALAAVEENANLSTIVEASDDAIIGQTLDGTITSWNKAAARLFGFTQEEAIGKSISMLFPQEKSIELAGILEAMANGESVHNLETVRIDKNGQRLDILATIFPIMRGDGTIIGAAAIDRDISERKRAQKMLQETDERYKLLVAKVKDYATFMIDPNGFIQTWNDGAKRLKGYDAAEIIGQHFSVFYTIEDRQRGLPDSHLKAAIAKGCFEESGWRLRKDGSRFFAEIIIIPLLSDSHELQGFTKITRDVTDRMLAEGKIADSMLRLSLALEAAAIGVWDVDLLNNSVWRSPQHDEIFGHHNPLPEWNFPIFLTYVIPEDLASTKAAFKKGLKHGTLRVQCRIKRADNKEIRWISVRGENFRTEKGTAVRMLGTVVDITDIKEKQDQLRMLAIMNEREDFMATLTHDMKNPLIGANRLLELLIVGSLGETTSQQSEIFQCLKESNSSLLKLIADLIDVYRLEKDVSDLLMSECDLVQIINAYLSRVAPFAKLRAIEMTAQLPEKLVLKADVSRLERVVQNLLDNALKFAPIGGRIQLRLFIEDDNAVIEIEDNGAGITREEQSRLFKRFSQGAEGKRYTGGSGLGLYLCKQIVEAHGGSIECQSQPNKMTIFRVLLPMYLM